MSSTTNDPKLAQMVDCYLDYRVKGLLAQHGTTDGLTAAFGLMFAALELRCYWNAVPGCCWHEGIVSFTNTDELLAELDARATAHVEAFPGLTLSEGASHA